MKAFIIITMLLVSTVTQAGYKEDMERFEKIAKETSAELQEVRWRDLPYPNDWKDEIQIKVYVNSLCKKERDELNNWIKSKDAIDRIMIKYPIRTATPEMRELRYDYSKIVQEKRMVIYKTMKTYNTDCEWSLLYDEHGTLGRGKMKPRWFLTR